MKRFHVRRKIGTLKKLWKVIVIIIISILLAFALTKILETSFSPSINVPLKNINFVVSPEDQLFNISYYFLPGYFSSTANAYACLYSPYVDLFQFNVTLSVDNNSWVELPLFKSASSPPNLKKYADLGLIANDKPMLITFYGIYSLPPQNPVFPPGVSNEMAVNSIKGLIVLQRQITPRDQVLEILVFFSIFSVLIALSRLLKDEWNKKTIRNNGPAIFVGDDM